MRKRSSKFPDRFLHWKLTIFFLCSGLWIAGAVSGRAWMTGAAIVLLGAAILMRFLPQPAGDQDENGEER